MPGKRVILVGRGEPTPVQKQLLSKALGAEPVIVKTIEQVNSAQQVVQAIKETGAEAVFALIAHPTVVSALQGARKATGVNYYIPKTEAVCTRTVGNIEEAKKLCASAGADIINTKVLPNGQISVRCTKTLSLMKNPIIKIEAEEEITL